MAIKSADLISSNLRRATWADGTLTILFLNGMTYRYTNVPEGVFDDLVAAPSSGGFFSKHVRNLYEYQRTDAGACPALVET